MEIQQERGDATKRVWLGKHSDATKRIRLDKQLKKVIIVLYVAKPLIRCCEAEHFDHPDHPNPGQQ